MRLTAPGLEQAPSVPVRQSRGAITRQSWSLALRREHACSAAVLVRPVKRAWKEPFLPLNTLLPAPFSWTGITLPIASSPT